MLEILLNYITLIVVSILLLGLVGLLFFKRKQLSKKQKTIIYLLCAIIVIYFIFIAILTFASGNAHPLGGPSPVR